jgi:phosphatidylinositol alpha 1,6-mannosyltransferase
MPGVRLVIVGDGSERAKLERSLRGAVFTGFQHGAELSAHHASFDVFAHTGLDETFCQAVQEALASGVPVVAPAAGGPLDLVTHGVNGYLWSP